MTSWEFPGSDPIDIVATITAGSVSINAADTDVTTVSLEAADGDRGEKVIEEVIVTFTDGRLEVTEPTRTHRLLRSYPGLSLEITAPARSTAEVRTASGDVTCRGPLGGLRTKTASGDIRSESVSGAISVNTASGDVWLEDSGADVDVSTASGDVRVGQVAGDVAVNSASGDLSVAAAGGSVRANTASGDIELRRVAAGTASVKTVSGDTVIGVAAGTGVYLDLSSLTGDVSSQLDETDGSGGSGLEITCRSVSGDIRIVSATA